MKGADPLPGRVPAVVVPRASTDPAEYPAPAPLNPAPEAAAISSALRQAGCNWGVELNRLSAALVSGIQAARRAAR